MLSFRVMEEKDLADVVALEQDAGPNPWLHKNFASCLKPGHLSLIAEWDDKPVGHAVLMIGAGEAHLLIITVAKSMQGQGIGRKLLQHLVDQATGKADTLFLEVRSSNVAAFNLYLQEGFSEIGRRRNYYPATAKRSSEDAIVMALDLIPADTYSPTGEKGQQHPQVASKS